MHLWEKLVWETISGSYPMRCSTVDGQACVFPYQENVRISSKKKACFHLFVSQGSEVNQCVNSRCPTKVDLVSSSAISKEFQRAFLLCKAINHSGLYLQHFHNHSAASKFMHSICMKITDFKPPRSEKALLIEYKSKPFNGFFWRFLGDFQPGNTKSQCCCIHKKF